MTSIQSAPRHNSTTGRAASFALHAVRAWFRVAAAVAPGAAERQAASLFLTPRRGRKPRGPLEDPSAGRYAMTVRETELEVAAWSWGSGPAVLLAHGWGGSAADLAPLGAELQGRGFRAVLFDFPAHGRSPGRRTHMLEWLRAMRAVAFAVGPLHAAAGHSFGGAAVALAMAEQGMDAGGAVLLAPVIGPAAFAERFAATIGLPAGRAEGMMRRVEEIVGRAPASLDSRHAAAGLRVPALIVHDRGDREVPWAHGKAIADAWPGSRLVETAGLGHTRLLRDPGILGTAAEFIAALPARRVPLGAAS